MTDSILQQLEERITILLAELEDLRFEIKLLKQENSELRSEKLRYTQKLQRLISLLDSIDAVTDEPAGLFVSTFELENIQGPEEYATI